MCYPGIRLLIVRRTLPELEDNHIRPLRQLLSGAAEYREKDRSFLFPNGSALRFGYCDAESDVLRYQGQEYDCVFLDEATQLTEYQFQTFKGCLRGVNDFPKRLYLTCNPGGVGHAWVKRLFIERSYREGERAEEYRFIPAQVYDNTALMEADRAYVERLESLPHELREAWLHGSWDVCAGQFFPEWNRAVHVCEPIEVSGSWRRYVTMDYGMDMLAAYVIAVDGEGTAWVIRELYEGRDLGEGHEGLIICGCGKGRSQRLHGRGKDRSHYFTFSKWLLYKTVYRFEKSFLDILTDTGDMEFHSQILNRLPVEAFFIASTDKERLGYFVYSETVSIDIVGNPINDTVFIVVEVIDVMGDKLNMRKDTLWISEGQKLSVALEDWMREKNCLEFYDDAFHNMKMAIQVAYYLSAQNAIIKEVRTQKAKRPRRPDGKPMNLRQWDVGYRISTPFFDKESVLADAASFPDEKSSGQAHGRIFVERIGTTFGQDQGEVYLR